MVKTTGISPTISMKNIYKGLLMSSAMVGAAISVSSKANADQVTVKSGDTLSQIANKAGTTVESLKINNNLQDVNKIYPGQELKVDNNAQSSVKTYTVKAGDSLWKIAQANGLSVDGVQFSDKANRSDLLNPDNVFQYKGEIGEDTNWNSVDKTGYYSVWIKNAHAGLHVPGTNNGDGSNIWGTLLVFAYGTTIYQTFINLGGFRLFIRSKTGSPTTEWNGWASAQFNNPESN